MERKNDRYDNKPIRFYDKGDHYELWFMDDFCVPGSGNMWENGKEYTLICDIAEELHNGDASKELHIFIWSFGGACDTLSTILQCIEKYRRKVAINMGCADSCGWILFFACDERYAALHSEFLYHEPSLFQFGKQEECAARIEYQRKRMSAMFLNENIQKYLTEEEKKLGQTTEIWITGADMILRGGCRNYELYRKRIAPKVVQNEFFSFDNKIYRFDRGKMYEYKQLGNHPIEDCKLIEYDQEDITCKEDWENAESILGDLLSQVKACKKGTASSTILKSKLNQILTLMNKRKV